MRAILTVLLVAVLALASASASPSMFSTPLERSQDPVPFAARDPTNRLAAAGLPTTMPTDPEMFKQVMQSQFPVLFGPNGIATQKFEMDQFNKTVQAEIVVEYIRFTILADAYNERNTPADIVAIKQISLGFKFECKACEYAVGKVEGFIADHGCGLASDVISKACDAIPYVGIIVAEGCKELLKWGCSKLLEHIMSGIRSPKQLCHDVLHTC